MSEFNPYDIPASAIPADEKAKMAARLANSRKKKFFIYHIAPEWSELVIWEGDPKNHHKIAAVTLQPSAKVPLEERIRVMTKTLREDYGFKGKIMVAEGVVCGEIIHEKRTPQ
jgi:hypothetical protein